MSSNAAPGTIQTASANANRPWWQLGLAAGIIAAAINVIIFFIYNAAASTPIQIQAIGGAGIQELPVFMVIVMSLVPALLAGLVAAGIRRWRGEFAATWFIAISVILTVLSLASPFTLPGTIAMSAKLTLAVMHIVAAVVIIVAMLPKLNAGRD